MPDEKNPHQPEVDAATEVWTETERNCNYTWWRKLLDLRYPTIPDKSEGEREET